LLLYQIHIYIYNVYRVVVVVVVVVDAVPLFFFFSSKSSSSGLRRRHGDITKVILLHSKEGICIYQKVSALFTAKNERANLQTLPVNVTRPAKVSKLRTTNGLRVLCKAGLKP